jgi:WD40 repeat protein
MIVLEGLRREVRALAFGHDGRELVAGGGYDKAVEIWDTTAGTVNRAFGQLTTSASDPLAVNPRLGWKYASTGYGKFNAQSPDGVWFPVDELGPKVYGQAVAFAVRPDGERVVVGYDHNCLVAAFAQRKDRPPRPLWHRPVDPTDKTGLLRLRGLAYFPEGARFAALEQTYRTGGTSRFTVRGDTTGDVISAVPVPAAEPTQIRISPDGASVVVRCGQVLNVWDATNFARPPVRVANDNRKHFTCVAFHPSGRFLAATSRDETVKLFDARTWKVARTFTWDVGKLHSVCFSPDGTRAAVGSAAGQIVMWDVDI